MVRAGYRLGYAARGSVLMGLVLMLTAITLLLAACESGGGNVAARTPSATPTSAASSSPTSNATPETISTPGAPVGIADLCALTPSVSAQLPANIPPYPGAELRLGSNQNGNGLYGLCSTAAVADVNRFYIAQIPAKGWKNLSSTSIGGTDQITATNGTTTLTITILTDGQVSGNTDIIIVTSDSANANG